MSFNNSEQIWLHRNGVEVIHNTRGAESFVAILHQRVGRGPVTKFEPLDRVEAETAKEAVQILCDQNNLLSPWDISDLKDFLRRKKLASESIIK